MTKEGKMLENNKKQNSSMNRSENYLRKKSVGERS